MFESLMHDLVSYNFREYDRALYREIENEQWCDGFEACRKQYERKAKMEGGDA